MMAKAAEASITRWKIWGIVQETPRSRFDNHKRERTNQESFPFRPQKAQRQPTKSTESQALKQLTCFILFVLFVGCLCAFCGYSS
jgi:hypothetical protein